MRGAGTVFAEATWIVNMNRGIYQENPKSGGSMKQIVGMLIAIVVIGILYSMQSKFMGKTEDMAGKLPTEVFEGGGKLLVVEFAASEAPDLCIEFMQGNVMGGEGGQIQTVCQHFEVGEQFYEVDVPDGVTVALDLTIKKPELDATMDWAVSVEDLLIHEDELTLDEELKKEQTFSLTYQIDDLADY